MRRTVNKRRSLGKFNRNVRKTSVFNAASRRGGWRL